MRHKFRNLLFVGTLLAASAAGVASAFEQPVELRHRLAGSGAESTRLVALTLDACGGAFDVDVLRLLIANNIPATVFATRRWIDRNPEGVAMLRQYPQLFEIEDHGANHVPAVIGTGRSVYGIAGNADASKLRDEVLGGAVAIEQAIGATPRWYRGATAKYDEAAIIDIERLGYRIAGFSLNADDGATLSRQAIVARLKAARGGDIIIAHMNKPASDTAEGLAIGLKWMLAEGFRFTKLGDMGVEPVPTAAIIRARKKTS